MKNYIYVKNNISNTVIYYCRANKRDNAIYKLCHLSNTPIHLIDIVAKDIKELSHCEEIANIEKENYEG